MKNYIMDIKDISKSYYTNKDEIKAIENFSYNVEKGKFIAIVGPSGCGKSTLLSIIGGLEEKTGGKIKKDDKLKIGYMLQEDALFPWKNILDNCLIGLKIKKELNNESKNRVINLLKKYGLDSFKYKYPNELSGGMRQRVALIRTLAINPDLLLLDEPFSALDYQTRLAVADDVYKIIREEEKTLIIVTHDLAEAISIADEIIVLSNRPSTIKKIIKINLPIKDTPINNRKQKEFSKYYEEIWKEIDYNV